MQKKPFNKDIPSFILDDKNWIPMWESFDAHLRIDRLRNTTITRLVRTGVWDPYNKTAVDQRIAYNFEVKTLKECGSFNQAYISTQPNQAETIQAVNSQWGIVTDVEIPVAQMDSYRRD